MARQFRYTRFCAVLPLCFSAPVFANSAPDHALDCLVEPSMVVNLSAPEPGQIDTVFVERNDRVEEGAFIAKLESSLELSAVRLAQHSVDAKAQLALRQKSVEYGQRTLERNRTLVKTSSVSKQQFDKIETEYEISRLQLQEQTERAERASLELDRARIAPLSYRAAVSAGTKATVDIQLGNGSSRIEAEVHATDLVADAASNTFGVQLVVPNPDLSIPGGVRCQVRFH